MEDALFMKNRLGALKRYFRDLGSKEKEEFLNLVSHDYPLALPFLEETGAESIYKMLLEITEKKGERYVAEQIGLLIFSPEWYGLLTELERFARNDGFHCLVRTLADETQQVFPY